MVKRSSIYAAACNFAAFALLMTFFYSLWGKTRNGLPLNETGVSGECH